MTSCTRVTPWGTVRTGASLGPTDSRSVRKAAAMTGETYQSSGYTTPDNHETSRSGWTGWITFAGVMMIIAGGLNSVYGLIGVINHWVVWTNRAALYLDISQWGWVHLARLAMLLRHRRVQRQHPGPHRRRDRRQPQPDRQLLLHPRLSALGPAWSRSTCSSSGRPPPTAARSATPESGTETSQPLDEIDDVAHELMIQVTSRTTRVVTDE